LLDGLLHLADALLQESMWARVWPISTR
jgi:hypothetical protein